MELRSFKLRLADEHVRVVPKTDAAGCPFSGPGVDLYGDVARSEHADLVVVGSHGHTGIAKVLLGSVASHIVSHAPCSVLVVKVQSS